MSSTEVGKPSGGLKLKPTLEQLNGRLIAVWPGKVGYTKTRYGRSAVVDVKAWLVRDEGNLSNPFTLTLWGRLAEAMTPKQWAIGRIRMGRAHSFIRADAETEARVRAMLPEGWR
jgi:hypothetical protein